MRIKRLVATGFTMIFATAVAVAGCGVDSGSDAAGDEVSTGEQAVAVTVDCKANSPNQYVGPNYSNAIAATQSTVIDAISNKNTAYDISGYCATAINNRRRTVHTRTKNGVTTSINPYYNLYNTSVVPTYTAIGVNVGATTGSSVCRLCKGLADAKAGGHAGYGSCYGIAPDATGPTTNDVSVGFCGAAIGQTAGAVVDGCLNLFENETGSGGHKGPIMWDSSRGISCVIGVYVDPTTGAKKAGITFSYSYPPRNGTMPNGGNCKVSGECLSNKCSNSRCVGFASSIPAGSTTVKSGVSACPASNSTNCSTHPEDTSLCFPRTLACASGVCTTSNTCGKGSSGKACATNADCTSNVCTNGTCG